MYWISVHLVQVMNIKLKKKTNSMELDAKSVFVLLHGDILAIKKYDLIKDMENIAQIQIKM